MFLQVCLPSLCPIFNAQMAHGSEVHEADTLDPENRQWTNGFHYQCNDGYIVSWVVKEQTQVVAAAAAGVAAEGLSPRTAKAEAEAVASLCMSLAENALVLLMLVEDHLRVEMQAFIVSLTTRSAAPVVSSSLDTLQVLQRSFEGVDSFGSRQFSSSGFDVVGGPFENSHLRKSLTASDTGSLSLEAFLKHFPYIDIIPQRQSVVLVVLLSVHCC